jgi:methionyl-tRNA formyltransferase
MIIKQKENKGSIKLKFIFFGTAEFGLPTLKALTESGHELVAVVTNPAKPAGRGQKLRETPVHSFCNENLSVPVLTPENLKNEFFLSELKEFEVDAFVVVAFSILPESLFSIPKMGTFNVHAALLPKFRGPAPIHRAIESGASKTGVTFFRIDRGVDTGNIVVQLSEDILEDDTTPTLYERLSVLGGKAAVEGLNSIESGTAIYREQDISLVSKAPLLKKSEAEIDWNMSAEKIVNRVRAFIPFPGTFTTILGKRVVVTAAKVFELDEKYSSGVVVSCKGDDLVVATENGGVALLELKPAGKRAMKTRDFLNGTDIKEGMKI